MATGTIKWFTKGYGFIIPDDGGPDVFAHATAAKQSGYDFLPEGVRITYELEASRSGKMTASNLPIT